MRVGDLPAAPNKALHRTTIPLRSIAFVELDRWVHYPVQCELKVPMKYQEQLDKIGKREYSRAELAKIRVNAEEKLKSGDLDAKVVIDAIDHASPIDDFVVFMGFCPDASLANRLDIEWRRDGTCTFIFLDSPQQVERFSSIRPGDLVILKKRQDFGRTMQLFGHGRVTGIDHDASGNRFLLMSWSEQDTVIEVPLLGCNSTVDIRSIERVKAEMPYYFYTWLNAPASSGRT